MNKQLAIETINRLRDERDALRRKLEQLREAALTVMDRVRRAGVQGWTMQQFLDDGSVRELVDALAQPAPAPARYQCERCGGTGVQPQGRHWDGSKYAEMPEQPCQLCGGEGKLGMIPSQPAQQPEAAKDRLREMTDEEADALIERVEDAVGMGKGAWDMTPGRELARSFAAAIAASKGEVQK